MSTQKCVICGKLYKRDHSILNLHNGKRIEVCARCFKRCIKCIELLLGKNDEEDHR